MSELKRIYVFGKDAQGTDVTEGDAADHELLGGKGAYLAEMSRLDLPIPTGFTITCQTCMDYVSAGDHWPSGLVEEIEQACSELERRVGKKLGDPHDPLLVSVRSSAPYSMHGMMDTVLNLGLNDRSVQGLIDQTGDPRFAWDAYRRFIQMFSCVVVGVDQDLFENALTARKVKAGVKNDVDMGVNDLKDLVDDFKALFSEHVSADLHPEYVDETGAVAFPQDPITQLIQAVRSVFGGWNDPRAIEYRTRYHIPHDVGIAVIVMAMVYGNKGDTSATGVAFTRNPADGTKPAYGRYLINAQGEDVVASIRTTYPLDTLSTMPGFEDAARDLDEVVDILEHHFHDMMDIEFTIEEGKLSILQTRIGRRTATAALKIAIDMVQEGLITKEEALLRIDPSQLDHLLLPEFESCESESVLCQGINASPGAAVGEIVFSSSDAVDAHDAGRDCILVRWETNPDDLPGIKVANGILTSHGGTTSHAAALARYMGIPCVCGADELIVDAANKEIVVNGSDVVLHEGDVISIEGTTGSVVAGPVTLVRPMLTGDLETIISWADEILGDNDMSDQKSEPSDLDGEDLSGSRSPLTRLTEAQAHLRPTDR